MRPTVNNRGFKPYKFWKPIRFAQNHNRIYLLRTTYLRQCRSKMAQKAHILCAVWA